MTQANRPINVLWLIDHVCYDGSLHGGGRLFMNLMPQFDSRRVRIFPYFLRASDEVKKVFADAGHPAKTLEIGKYDALAPFKIAALCKQHDIDVMHLFCYAASTFGRMVGAVKGIPTVVHDFDTQIYFPYPLYLKVLDRMLANQTGHAFAASAMCKEYMRDVRAIPDARIQVLYHAIPNSQVQTATQMTRELARGKLGLKDEPVFCAVTKLGPERGNETMLSAFAEVRKSLPNALLYIVYKPTLYHRMPEGYDAIEWAKDPAQMKSRIMKAIEERGLTDAVRMVESLERPEVYYAASDVMLAPFENIRFSSVNLVEGMAYGRPFVATNIGEPAELVERYDCGLSVEVGNVAQMAAAMIKLGSDANLRDELGRQARVGARDLTVDAAAARLSGLYENLRKDGVVEAHTSARAAS